MNNQDAVRIIDKRMTDFGIEYRLSTADIEPWVSCQTLRWNSPELVEFYEWLIKFGFNKTQEYGLVAPPPPSPPVLSPTPIRTGHNKGISMGSIVPKMSALSKKRDLEPDADGIQDNQLHQQQQQQQQQHVDREPESKRPRISPESPSSSSRDLPRDDAITPTKIPVGDGSKEEEEKEPQQEPDDLHLQGLNLSSTSASASWPPVEPQQMQQAIDRELVADSKTPELKVKDFTRGMEQLVEVYFTEGVDMLGLEVFDTLLGPYRKPTPNFIASFFYTVILSPLTEDVVIERGLQSLDRVLSLHGPEPFAMIWQLEKCQEKIRDYNADFMRFLPQRPESNSRFQEENDFDLPAAMMQENRHLTMDRIPRFDQATKHSSVAQLPPWADMWEMMATLVCSTDSKNMNTGRRGYGGSTSVYLKLQEYRIRRRNRDIVQYVDHNVAYEVDDGESAQQDSLYHDGDITSGDDVGGNHDDDDDDDDGAYGRSNVGGRGRGQNGGRGRRAAMNTGVTRTSTRDKGKRTSSSLACGGNPLTLDGNPTDTTEVLLERDQFRQRTWNRPEKVIREQCGRSIVSLMLRVLEHDAVLTNVSQKSAFYRRVLNVDVHQPSSSVRKCLEFVFRTLEDATDQSRFFDEWVAAEDKVQGQRLDAHQNRDDDDADDEEELLMYSLQSKNDDHPPEQNTRATEISNNGTSKNKNKNGHQKRTVFTAAGKELLEISLDTLTLFLRFVQASVHRHITLKDVVDQVLSRSRKISKRCWDLWLKGLIRGSDRICRLNWKDDDAASFENGGISTSEQPAVIQNVGRGGVNSFVVELVDKWFKKYTSAADLADSSTWSGGPLSLQRVVDHYAHPGTLRPRDPQNASRTTLSQQSCSSGKGKRQQRVKFEEDYKDEIEDEGPWDAKDLIQIEWTVLMLENLLWAWIESRGITQAEAREVGLLDLLCVSCSVAASSMEGSSSPRWDQQDDGKQDGVIEKELGGTNCLGWRTMTRTLKRIGGPLQSRWKDLEEILLATIEANEVS